MFGMCDVCKGFVGTIFCGSFSNNGLVELLLRLLTGYYEILSIIM